MKHVESLFSLLLSSIDKIPRPFQHWKWERGLLLCLSTLSLPLIWISWSEWGREERRDADETNEGAQESQESRNATSDFTQCDVPFYCWRALTIDKTQGEACSCYFCSLLPNLRFSRLKSEGGRREKRKKEESTEKEGVGYLSDIQPLYNPPPPRPMCFFSLFLSSSAFNYSNIGILGTE